ncbi:MAG: hypothetical protein WCP79_15610 [Bacillota bacterium]
MKTFDKYSEYYDLLYADKDYGSECDYIEKLIPTFDLTQLKPNNHGIR